MCSNQILCQEQHSKTNANSGRNFLIKKKKDGMSEVSLVVLVYTPSTQGVEVGRS